MINIKTIKTRDEEFDSKLLLRMVEGNGEDKGREGDRKVIERGCMEGRQWIEDWTVDGALHTECKVGNKSWSKWKFTLHTRKFLSTKMIKMTYYNLSWNSPKPKYLWSWMGTCCSLIFGEWHNCMVGRINFMSWLSIILQLDNIAIQ